MSKITFVRNKKNFFILLSFLAFLFLTLMLLRNNAYITEYIFAQGICLYLTKAVSCVFGVFGFSVAEVFIVLAPFFLIAGAVIFVKRLIKAPFKNRFLLNSLIVILSVSFFAADSFFLLWGMNYNRNSLETILDIPIVYYSADELFETGMAITKRLNEISEYVSRNEDGLYFIENAKEKLERADEGYNVLYEKSRLSIFEGGYSAPKPVFFSEALSYTFISGIYIPFTGEANVNMAFGNLLLLSSACHEMGHQRGVAFEDEANYMAFISCVNNPDLDYQYSGYVLGLFNISNDLYKYDERLYNILMQSLDEKIIDDINEYQRIVEKYRSPIKDVSNKINDTYLRTMGQEGVLSYSRVVNFIVCDYIKNGGFERN